MALVFAMIFRFVKVFCVIADRKIKLMMEIELQPAKWYNIYIIIVIERERERRKERERVLMCIDI